MRIYLRRALLPLVLIIGAVIRFWHIGRPSLWYDELYTVWSSRLPLSSIFMEEAAARHPPVFYYLGHFWFSISSGDTGVRLISWAAGVGAILLVYLIARKLFSVEAALWSAALAAVSPFLIWYSREATFYSWLAFISLLSFLFLIKSILDGGWLNWAVYLIATTLAVFSFFLSPLLLIAELAAVLVLRKREGNYLPLIASQAFLFSQAAAVGVMVLWLTAAKMRQTVTFSAFRAELVHGLATAPFVLAGGPLWEGFSGGKRFVLPVALAVFVGAAVLSARFRRIILNKRFVSLSLFAVTLLIGPLFVYALMADGSGPFRLYSWATPAFLILFSACLMAIPWKLRLGVGGSIILLLLVFTVPPVINKQNWDLRSVMNVISDNQQKGDTILCFPMYHGVVGADHYIHRPIRVLGGLINAQQTGVYFLQGSWQGYAGNEKYREVQGPALDQRFNEDLGKATRIWMIAGDGSAGEYPRGDVVFRSLTEKWTRAGAWDIPPFSLTLFVRRDGSANR